MGIKFFNLQMIPWCFHLMGNFHISCVQLQNEEQQRQVKQRATIKLIKSDGLVKIYDRPIKVSELMSEFPKHMVCRSDSFYIGQKIPALSETDNLQLGHKYFLLPKHCFQSVLSFVNISSFVTSSSLSTMNPKLNQSFDPKSAFLKTASTCQPFDIQKSPSGCLQIQVSDEFISRLMQQSKNVKETGNEDDNTPATATSKVCTTPQLVKDYTNLVGSRQWKPKLETIKESDYKKKKLYSSFGIRRSKKKSTLSCNKLNQQFSSSSNSTSHVRLSGPQLVQHPLLVSNKTCSRSKAKLRIKSRK